MLSKQNHNVTELNFRRFADNDRLRRPPLRVAYVSHLNDLRMGGQRSIAALVQHIDRRQVEPFGICPGTGAFSEFLTQADCQVLSVDFPALKLINIFRIVKTLLRLRRYFRDRSIDIVHSDEERSTLYCNIAAIGLASKVLYHVRTARPHHLDALNLRLADALIGISRGALARFRSYAMIESKSTVIFNGVDSRTFVPAEDKSETRSQLELPTQRFIVAFIGNIKQSKGISDLIAAWQHLGRRLDPESMPLLLLIGDAAEGDPAVSALQGLLHTPFWREHVRLLPHQGNIQEWMSAVDAVVLPSYQGEGMGRVLFEAMACGAIAIGSDIAGVREALTADSGLLIPPAAPDELAHSIISLMSDPDRQERYRVHGLQRARTVFSIDRHAQNVLDLYQQLIPSATGSAYG